MAIQVKGIPTNVQIQIYGQEKAEKLALVKAIRGGDKVTALFPNGLKLVNGKAVPEYKALTGKANGLLIFPEHVVINLGGKFGKPGVVDASNIVKVTRSE